MRLRCSATDRNHSIENPKGISWARTSAAQEQLNQRGFMEWALVWAEIGRNAHHPFVCSPR